MLHVPKLGSRLIFIILLRHVDFVAIDNMVTEESTFYKTCLTLLDRGSISIQQKHDLTHLELKTLNHV